MQEIVTWAPNCVFLAKHPSDSNKSGEFSRFWPEWHRYSRCLKTDDIIYGDRILISPSHNPDMNEFIQWSDNLPLLGRFSNSHAILGLFEFEKIDAYNRTRQKVSMDNWRKLYDACLDIGSIPPTFGRNTSQKPHIRYMGKLKRKVT